MKAWEGIRWELSEESKLPDVAITKLGSDNTSSLFWPLHGGFLVRAPVRNEAAERHCSRSCINVTPLVYIMQEETFIVER